VLRVRSLLYLEQSTLEEQKLCSWREADTHCSRLGEVDALGTEPVAPVPCATAGGCMLMYGETERVVAGVVLLWR